MKLHKLQSYCHFDMKLIPTWGVITQGNTTICECGKSKCPKPGKHPRIRNWQHQASSSWLTIQSWNKMWPMANWGWLQDKTFTIDVDAHRGGRESFLEWEEVSGGPDKTLTQFTPNGGMHLIYTQPEHFILPAIDDFMPGIEVRGSGSYIMIDPSRSLHNAWRWKDAFSSYSEIKVCDDSTLSLLFHKVSHGNDGKVSPGQKKSDLPATEVFFERGFGFHTGSRNVDAYRLSWRLLALNECRPSTWPLDYIVRVMMRIWLKTPQNNESFTWDECLDCLKSAYQRRTRQRKEEDSKNQNLLSHINIG